MADAQAALRDTEAKINSTEEPADTDSAEALIRKHEIAKAELETNSRRLAAIEVCAPTARSPDRTLSFGPKPRPDTVVWPGVCSSPVSMQTIGCVRRRKARP